MLTVVIPSYNEDKIIRKTVSVLCSLLEKERIDYELLFVNDGSNDNTQRILEQEASLNPHIHVIMFSRNFGKESAIAAGLALSKGECVAVMDGDLQHPPKVLVQMYRLWESGYEVVNGVKKTRGEESVMHKFSSRMFYKIMTQTTGLDMSGSSDFKLLDRKVVDILMAMPEYHSFFRALSSWVGFNSTSVEFDVADREEGESKWSTIALIKYAINNILEFSSAPMQIVTVAGIVTFIIAFVVSIQTLIRYFTGTSAEGFTTVIILMLFLGSVLMLGIGVLGLYISKIYDEVKRRPRYIISKYI
ncbi:MAG: glycosyltransferase [Clostridiales bacterium]|nr:glycosyltransferase [Clostridiales bacterium]